MALKEKLSDIFTLDERLLLSWAQLEPHLMAGKIEFTEVKTRAKWTKTSEELTITHTFPPPGEEERQANSCYYHLGTRGFSFQIIIKQKKKKAALRISLRFAPLMVKEEGPNLVLPTKGITITAEGAKSQNAFNKEQNLSLKDTIAWGWPKFLDREANETDPITVTVKIPPEVTAKEN